MNFGPQTTEPDSFAIMDRALELGINFFDTANVYGWKTGEGLHRADHRPVAGAGRRAAREDRAGDQGLRRDGRWPNERRLSAYHIRRACEDSLRRLQTDHIDLYQMHHVDRETPWEEIWQAMEQLVREGKVLYVGQQQLRRLAHRPGARTAAAAGTSSGSSPSRASTTSPRGRSSWR